MPPNIRINKPEIPPGRLMPSSVKETSGEPRKCRCPYCREVAEWKENKCPLCGRGARLSDFFERKPSKAGSRREERERRRQEVWKSVGAGGIWGLAAFQSPKMRWILLFGFLAVVGALVSQPKPNKDNAAAIKLCKWNMNVLRQALEIFQNDCGRFPTTAEGLASLVHKPDVEGWKGPYIRKLKHDPWRRSFNYGSDGASFTLFSNGPDRVKGTADDVVSVVEEPTVKTPSAEDTAVTIEKKQNVRQFVNPH